MPSKPASFRPRGIPTRIRQRQAHDAKRRVEKPWRALYKTPQWRAIREQVLADQPICRRCLEEGNVEPSTIVHHVHRHHGDPVKFFEGPFEGICKPHHDRDAQREEAAGA